TGPDRHRRGRRGRGDATPPAPAGRRQRPREPRVPPPAARRPRPLDPRNPTPTHRTGPLTPACLYPDRFPLPVHLLGRAPLPPGKYLRFLTVQRAYPH